MISRRAICISALACVAGAPRAFADARFWESLTEQLGRDIAVFLGLERATDTIQKADYSAADRSEAVDEIEDLTRQLSGLVTSQTGFLNLLKLYVTYAKEGRPASELNGLWDNVTYDVNSLLSKVENAKIALDRSTQLKKRLDSTTADELNQLLRGRATLLRRLAPMPAPTSAEEIAALERLAERYGLLHDRLFSLLLSLSGARDRLVA